MYNSSNDTTSQDVTINVNDVYEYNGGSTLLAEFVLCLNIMHMKGIKYLYDDLQKQKLDNVAQLRQRYTHALLDDIEVISKLLDPNLSNPVKLEFKKNFYDEALKMPQDRSKEYNEFIECWARQPDALLLPGKLSAKLLLTLDKEELDSTQLQEQLMEILNHDKQVSTTQCDKDFHRTVITYMGKDKIPRQISLDELKNSPDLNLTNEQREFLASYWHQGTFTGAAYMYLSKSFYNSPQKHDNVLPLNNFHVTYDENQEVPIFIDASDDRVTVCGVIETYLRDVTNLEAPNKPYAAILFELDLSNMNDNGFTPCCSPKLPFQVYTSTPSEWNLDIPESLHRSTEPVAPEIANIKNLSTQAFVASVCSTKENTNSFTHEQSKAWKCLVQRHGIREALDITIDYLYPKDQDNQTKDKYNKIQETSNVIKKILTIDTIPNNDQAKRKSYDDRIDVLKKSMAHFCKIEPHKEPRNQFTREILNLFDELHNSHENIVSKKDIKKNIVTILSPLFTNNRDVKELKSVINQVIGENKKSKVTFKEFWKKLKTKILDIIDRVLLRRNKKYECIINKYPELMKKMRESLSTLNKELQGKEIPTNNTNKANTNLSKS